MEPSTRSDARDLLERRKRRPQHDCLTVFVDATATGAPGELGVLACSECGVMLAGEFGELVDHHGARWHVDANSKRLGGEDDLDQTLAKTRLNHLFERWHHAGVVCCNAGLELGQKL